jgi:hypothetical protein
VAGVEHVPAHRLAHIADADQGDTHFDIPSRSIFV